MKTWDRLLFSGCFIDSAGITLLETAQLCIVGDYQIFMVFFLFLYDSCYKTRGKLKNWTSIFITLHGTTTIGQILLNKKLYLKIRDIVQSKKRYIFQTVTFQAFLQ